jgi:hypothetical protein
MKGGAQNLGCSLFDGRLLQPLRASAALGADVLRGGGLGLSRRFATFGSGGGSLKGEELNKGQGKGMKKGNMNCTFLALSAFFLRSLISLLSARKREHKTWRRGICVCACARMEHGKTKNQIQKEKKKTSKTIE